MKEAEPVVVLPIAMKFPVVAKFLCSMNLADRVINFTKCHKVWLQREPTNRYDRRAVQIRVSQVDVFTN